MWFDAHRVSYGATAHRAFALLFGPLVKEYKTAATYIILQQIERNEEWKKIAQTCDDWPSMRRVLQKMGQGEGDWIRLSIHDRDIDSRVLTMLIRERYNDSAYDRTKKKTKTVAKTAGEDEG